MPFELLPLPYAFNTLEPYMSQKTLEFPTCKKGFEMLTFKQNLFSYKCLSLPC